VDLRQAVAGLALAASLAAGARAQASIEQQVQDGSVLSPAAARSLEDALSKNPHDLTARTKLLGYYFHQWMAVGEEQTRASRRRHILWFVKNHPEHPAIVQWEATLDPKNTAIADPEGYEQVKKIWTAIIESSPNSYAIANAGRFFQLTDKPLAEKAFLRAIAIDPRNGEWPWRLGFLYGLAVVGVDALAFNGQPASVDPLEPDGPFAKHARAQLEKSTSSVMLAVAANVITRHGWILAPSDKVRSSYLDTAEKLYRRATEIDPANPQWKQLLTQTQAMRSQLQAEEPGGARRRRTGTP
jgi:tetratricopeptide (TPR) repeat protein